MMLSTLEVSKKWEVLITYAGSDWIMNCGGTSDQYSGIITAGATTAPTLTYVLPSIPDSLAGMRDAIKTKAAEIRRSAPKEFNKYINSSDLLHEFIAFLGEQKVRQSEVMGLPIELFIKWLIIRACEEDHEEPNVTLTLPSPKRQPRCLGCGRFVPKALSPTLHNVRCAEFYFSRQAVKV